MIRPHGFGARVVAGFAALALACPAWPQPPAKEQQASQSEAVPADGEVQEKVIWGLLIRYAVSKLASHAFDMFLQWLLPRLTGGSGGFAERVSALLLKDSGAFFAPRSAGGAVVPAAAQPAAQVVVGNPEKPLQVDGDQANYEGVHIALMMDVDGGKTFAFRPVNEGFRTGERFKLRVVATFGGELTIENINPRGERRQIYPPRPDQVVMLQKASETLLPLGADQFFQFTGATGREQLVVTVTHPLALGDAASRHKVYRQDAKYGSNLLQEVGKGTYPAIQQAIELTHISR